MHNHPQGGLGTMNILLILLFMGLLTSVSVAEQVPIQDPVVVQFTQPVFFVSPDGTPYLVMPDTYTVEPAHPWLRLIPAERKDAILIEAATINHEESLQTQTAVIIESETGKIHLLLLFPDGKALEARGSSSGIQSRATLRATLSQRQIQQALTAKRPSSPKLSFSPVPSTPKPTVTPKLPGNPQVQVQGSPPVPVLDQPAPNASLANPALSFRWHPPSTNPAQTRYELCVAEAGTVCGAAQTSIVFKTVEAAAQAGTAQYELGIEPPAGSAQNTTGTPITINRYDVTLPIRFQGKRLHWLIRACAPNPNKLVLGGGIAESCSQSSQRTLQWPLPPPKLEEPGMNSVLETLRPTFHWGYDALQGVDYFLLCLSKPGIACPKQATTTDTTLVVQVPVNISQSPRSYSPSSDWTFLRNGPFHWTVAACNRTFGCLYQQAVRQISLAKPAAPILISPAPTVALGLTNYYSNGNPRSEHPVSFAWQSVPKASLYSICLAPMGQPCGPPPGPAPESSGMMFRSGTTPGTNLTLQLPNDLWWDHEQGTRFQWTVSACNSVGVCTASSPRPVQFKVSIHSFANLYPTFQSSQCTNCHGMANHNAKYQQHVSAGRFPAGTNPTTGTICANCHTAERGFADGWRAPSASLDFTGKTFGETCSMIRHGATYTQKGMKQHLLTDELVTWAVRHLPGNPVVNLALWVQRVTNWLSKANDYEYPSGRPEPYTVRCGSLPIGE